MAKKAKADSENPRDFRKVFAGTERKPATKAEKEFNGMIEENLEIHKFDQVMNREQFAASNKDVLLTVYINELFMSEKITLLHADNSHQECAIHKVGDQVVLCLPAHPDWEEFLELYSQLTPE